MNILTAERAALSGSTVKKSQLFRQARARCEAIGLHRLVPASMAILMGEELAKIDPKAELNYTTNAVSSDYTGEKKGKFHDGGDPTNPAKQFEREVVEAYRTMYKELLDIAEGRAAPYIYQPEWGNSPQNGAKMIIRCVRTEDLSEKDKAALIEQARDFIAERPTPEEFTYTYDRTKVV